MNVSSVGAESGFVELREGIRLLSVVPADVEDTALVKLSVAPLVFFETVSGVDTPRVLESLLGRRSAVVVMSVTVREVDFSGVSPEWIMVLVVCVFGFDCIVVRECPVCVSGVVRDLEEWTESEGLDPCVVSPEECSE